MASNLSIRWLQRALDNLDKEADYIAKENPKAAQDFVTQVFYEIELLKDHPHLGRAGRVMHTRELVVQAYPYIIPYRVRQGYIEILRIFHTARKYPP